MAPPFVYQPFDPSAIVPSIAALIARRNDPYARMAENIAAGNARAAEITAAANADAARTSGDVWGRAITQIGQLPMQVMQQRRADQDAAQLRALRQSEIAQNNQRTQEAAIEAQNRALRQQVGSVILKHTVTENGHTKYDVDGFLNEVKDNPAMAAFAHEPLDAMQKANDSYQQWVEGRFKTKQAALQDIYAKTAEAGGAPEDFEVIAFPYAKNQVLTKEDLAPMFERLHQAPDQQSRLTLLRGAGGVKPEYKEVPQGGSLAVLYPGAPPQTVLSTPAKLTDAEAALDAYAKSVIGPQATYKDLTDAQRLAYQKREADLKANSAYFQHQRERQYDIANPIPTKAKSQDELEQEYRSALLRELTGRGGPIGQSHAKVEQANNLLTLMDQYLDPKTGTYNIPNAQYSGLALGLARLLSGTGSVGIKLEQELKQGTLKGDLAKMLTYVTGQPVTGSTQAIFQNLRDSIEREGASAQANRDQSLAGMRGLAPTDLEDSRRQKLESASLVPLRQSRVIRNKETGEYKLQVSIDGGKTWK